MADFHRSLFSRGKISAGNAYDDVFGGPPKFAVSSFSSRVDDYSEIFGNFFGPKSSSIPLLDFPALEEDEVLFDARSTGVEYSEIFGGSEDAGFAFSCEEVFEERQGQEDASSNVRAQAETLPRQQCPAVVSVTPSKRYSETSHLIYNDTNQFKVSYNKRNQSEGDPLNGTTHIAQFHEVPGFTVVVDSLPPSPPAKGDKSLPKVNSDACLNEVSNGGILEQSHFGEAVSLAPISSCFIPSTENDLKADVKELDSTSTAPKDIPANAYFDLNYSSYHLPSELSENQNQLGLKSTTSEDAPASDLHQLHKLETHLPAGEDKTSKGEAFLTVDDFNLVTQPSRLPPPSRPPPKLGRPKQVKAYPGEKCSWKPPRIYETYHSGPTFEIHTIEEGAKDGSSPLFDVEVDPSSAAAASTAFMREAMEKAQATINSAKESMERRRDNYQSRMKLRVNEDKTVKERRHRRTAPENQKFKEEDAQEPSERNDREMKDCSRDEVQKVMIAAHVASNIEKKVGFMELTKESSDRSPWKEPGAPFMTQKKVDEAKEVKLEKQFHKPVNNDNESDVTAMIAECERNDKKAAKKNTVFENNEKLKASVREVSQKKLKASKETHMQEEKMNLETSEEYPEPGENAKRPKADLDTSKVDGQKKLIEAKETHQHEADHTHKDNEMKLKSTKEAGELEENEQRLKAAREREDEEKRQKSTFECVESEKRTKAYCEEEEELKRLKASLEHVEAEKRLKADWEIEEVEKRRKVARECEEEEKRLKAAREREEEEMRLQASLEHEKEVNRLKVAREREEEEKRLKAAREHEDEEKRLKEALEHEKEVNRLKADRERAEEEEKTLKAALEHEKEVKRLKAAHEREEAKRLKETRECEEEERRLKAALEQEKEMKRLKIARDHEEEKRSKAACEWEEVEKGLKTTYVREVEDKMLKADLEEDDNKIEGVKKVLDSGENSNKLKANEEANEWEENEKNTKEASMFVEKKLKLKLEDSSEKLNKCHVAKENKESKKITKVVNEVSEHDTFEQHLEAAKIACELDENRKALKSAQEPHELEVIVKKLEVTHEVNGHEDPKEEMDGTRAVPLDDNGGEKKLGETLEASVWEDQERKPKISVVVNEVGESEQNLKMVKEDNDFVKNVQSTNDFEIMSQGVLLGAQSEMKVELPPMDTVCNGKEKVLRTAPQVFVNKGKDREEKIMNEIHKQGEREKEEKKCKERELEQVRQKKIEEEREREREREKDRIAVERAVREARDRAFVEARERAERAAVERVTTEARQRARAEARERAEKSSLAEKAAIEASRTRAERAAVERATAEARDRAVEKAMAERAALREKPDGGMRQNRSSSDSRELRSTDGDSAKRCKARLERHQRTVQRAAKALAEKNIRDILAQREQTERNRLAETLDADIKRWSNGKEGNLRALLSTLQYILGPESGWQPIPLTAVITAVAVKKAYRKATLCVHPDKVQQRGASIQQKYICEKVFDLLKEAWNKFNSEER